MVRSAGLVCFTAFIILPRAFRALSAEPTAVVWISARQITAFGRPNCTISLMTNPRPWPDLVRPATRAHADRVAALGAAARTTPVSGVSLAWGSVQA